MSCLHDRLGLQHNHSGGSYSCPHPHCDPEFESCPPDTPPTDEGRGTACPGVRTCAFIDGHAHSPGCPREHCPDLHERVAALEADVSEKDRQIARLHQLVCDAGNFIDPQDLDQWKQASLGEVTVCEDSFNRMRADRDEARTRVAALEAGIRSHRDQRGDDRCWLDDQELYALLPEGTADTRLPPPDEMLANCKRFIASRQPGGEPYVSAQREIERLEAEQRDALAVLQPSMPESGLVDACRQRMQAYVSERDNAVTLEARVAALEAENQRLTERCAVLEDYAGRSTQDANRYYAAWQATAETAWTAGVRIAQLTAAVAVYRGALEKRIAFHYSEESVGAEEYYIVDELELILRDADVAVAKLKGAQ